MRPNGLVQIAGDQILVHIGGVQVRHGEPSPELLGRAKVGTDDVIAIAVLVQAASEIAEMRLQYGLLETGEDLRPGEKRVDHSFLQSAGWPDWRSVSGSC